MKMWMVGSAIDRAGSTVYSQPFCLKRAPAVSLIGVDQVPLVLQRFVKLVVSAIFAIGDQDQVFAFEVF